ncbi:MAG: hypothetical protein JSU96_09905 [Acidobacteriota bacterium]|nr:MAG: hypothetical protein JSU96_09905 [Acidobacteriota bacterium]
MNSRSGQPFRLFGTIPILLFFLLAPISVAGQDSAPTADASPSPVEEVEDLVNIDFRNDLRLFTVMAAVNVAGFDYETPGRTMSDTRLAVREAMSNLDPLLLMRLRTVYATKRFRNELETHTAYTSLALLLDGPPLFEFPQGGPAIPTDVQRILGFDELLAQFYQQGNIEALWERFRPVYTAYLGQYRPIFKDVIRDTLAYFRIPARIVLDRQIVLIPDPLAFNDVVHARNLEKVYYIVVGPTEDPASNYVQLQHEYLHFLIDPLVEKHGGTLLKTRDLLKLAQSQPNLSQDFMDRYLLIVGESLIEAILYRLHPPEDSKERNLELHNRGLIFVPYFLRKMEEFENNDELPLPLFLEAAFDGIVEDEIKNDSNRLGEIQAQVEEAARQAEEARMKEQAEWEARKQRTDRLNAGIQALLQKDYTAADTAFNELLTADPTDGTAQFYLAQSTAQQGLNDEASQHYRKVIENPVVESWMKAWAIIRVGRYEAFQGDFSSARKHFKDVLGMSGELQGAREAAQSSLESLPEEPPR